MIALTIPQPAAGLIASGICKVYSTRNVTINSLAGHTFLLHASGVNGTRNDKSSDEVRDAEIRRRAPELVQDDSQAWWRATRERGTFLAAIVVSPRVRMLNVTHLGPRKSDTAWSRATVEDYFAKLGMPDQARWVAPPAMYHVNELVLLEKPVACRGRSGPWTVPEDVQGAVAARLPKEVVEALHRSSAALKK